MSWDLAKQELNAWLQNLPVEEQALLGEEDFDYLFQGLSRMLEMLAQVYSGPSLSTMQAQAPRAFQMWAVSLYQVLESAAPWLSEVGGQMRDEAYQRMGLDQRHQAAVQMLEEAKEACADLQREIDQLEEEERQREESLREQERLNQRKQVLLEAARINPTPEGLDELADEVQSLEEQFGEAADLLARRQELARSLEETQELAQAVQDACDNEDLPRLAQGLTELSQAIEAKAKELAPRLDQIAPGLIEARNHAQHLVEELAGLQKEAEELRKQIERRAKGLERYQQVNRELAGQLGAGREVHQLLEQAEQNLRECDHKFREMMAQREREAQGQG